MAIQKNNIIFLDTNILSDIGRFDEGKIRDIVFQLMVDMKLIIAMTPFNILEVENIPDKAVKDHIHYFLNLANTIVLKGMIDLLDDEITAYIQNTIIDPMCFVSTLVSKSKDGKPFNYQTILNDLLNNSGYKVALEEHYEFLNRLQNHLKTKLQVPEKKFVEILFKERLRKSYPELEKYDWKSIADHCPSYMAYAYSVYDKIGSKGLRKKAGEMNDTAMSYIFPYVGIVVTEKRQATIFNRLKNDGSIPALKNTVILKHSDVFQEQDFQLKEVLAGV